LCRQGPSLTEAGLGSVRTIVASGGRCQ
jgi:uncharacterized protein (DUF1697 family)